MTPKFMSQLKLDISGEGICKDMASSISKSLEMLSVGASLYESYIMKINYCLAV